MALPEHGQNRDQSRQVIYPRLYNPLPSGLVSLSTKKDEVVSRRKHITHHRNTPVC